MKRSISYELYSSLVRKTHLVVRNNKDLTVFEASTGAILVINFNSGDNE